MTGMFVHPAARLENAMFEDVARTVLPIEFEGREVVFDAHAYEDQSVSYQAMALVRRIDARVPLVPIVRVHSGCVTGDIFHSLRCDCYQQLQKALSRVVASDYGIIVYLPHHEGRGISHHRRVGTEDLDPDGALRFVEAQVFPGSLAVHHDPRRADELAHEDVGTETPAQPPERGLAHARLGREVQRSGIAPQHVDDVVTHGGKLGIRRDRKKSPGYPGGDRPPVSGYSPPAER